jgi:DNA-binding NtrC family response regulator
MMRNKKSIIIIEDESELAGMMKDRLDEEGFLTVISGSRVEMLMKMRNQEFDLVICDLNIKGSAGGDTIYNVLKFTEEAKKKSPIIVVSGNIDSDIMKDYGKVIKAAFVKPVNMDLLLQKIHDLVK